MTNEILNVIKRRRSTRLFTDAQVKKEEIESIMEAGIYAPSGMNQQSWHFTVIQNPELIDEINSSIKETLKKSTNERRKAMGENKDLHLFYNAPTLIIASGNTSNITPVADTSAAIQNILLAAESLDVGTCWIGSVHELFNGEMRDEYLKKLKIPQGHEPYFGIAMGYKKVRVENAPVRKENSVTYL